MNGEALTDLSAIPRSENREYGQRMLNRMVYIATRHQPAVNSSTLKTMTTEELNESMADIEALAWYERWTREIQQSAT